MQESSQSNPLLSINNYSPLVISRNDKNKQPALLANALTGINRNNNNFLQYKIIGAPKNFKTRCVP
jgi:hypothetical protein